MQIQKLDKHETNDFKALIEIFKTVFEHSQQTPDAEYLGHLLAKTDFMVFVVKAADGQVLGGLTIYVLHGYYNPKPIAYIYDVGIMPDFQGQGLGKALIAEVCRYCRDNGFEDAYVSAESEDLDVVNFYRKTPYSSALNAIHFTYDF